MKKLFTILFIIASIIAEAQRTYLLQGMKDEWLINRMEIKYPSLFKFSSIKPYSRKFAVTAIQIIDSLYLDVHGKKTVHYPSSIDEYNYASLLASNSEWSNPIP